MPTENTAPEVQAPEAPAPVAQAPEPEAPPEPVAETPEVEPAPEVPPSEPVAEAPAVEPPVFPSADEYDWDSYDPSADGWQDSLPEEVRGWADRLHGYYSPQIADAREAEAFANRLAQQALTGDSASPAFAELNEKLSAATSENESFQAKISELEAKLQEATGNYETYRDSIEDGKLQSFMGTYKDALEAASSEDIESFKELAADLEAFDDPSLTYLTFDEAWKVVASGKAAELKRMHSDRVPAGYALRLLGLDGSGPVSEAPKPPEKPAPSRSEAAVNGADGAGSRPAVKATSPKSEKSGNPHTDRAAAVRRAMAKFGFSG